MERSYCTDLDHGVRHRLLRIARESITHGLLEKRPLEIPSHELTGVLGDLRGSFVTLMQQGVLRGCVGSLEAIRPLGVSVSEAAFGAAFRDSRFQPLGKQELDLVTIHISVLSELQPIPVTDETLLLRQLQVGIDGLLLQEDWCRATFLPKVWDQIPDPGEFLRALKLKAGLAPNYWSETLRFFRYRTDSFSEPAPARPVVA